MVVVLEYQVKDRIRLTVNDMVMMKVATMRRCKVQSQTRRLEEK